MKPLNLIRFYREKMGMPQAYLAVHAKTSVPTLVKWEKGTREPSLLQLLLVAHVLGIPVSNLINWEEIDKLEAGS